jgi:hypothetical protein
MALRPEIIVIDDPDHVADVLDAMAGFARRGQGWVNVQPEVAPDALPPARSALTQYFRRNSPEAALGTWMSAPAGAAEATLGVQHALGARIGPHLGDWQLALHDGWRRTQDSPRRGLLVAVPADEAHARVLRWLLDVTLHATRPETTGRWEASLYAGRS